MGIQRKGARVPRRKVNTAKASSAGPQFAFTKRVKPNAGCKSLSILAPSFLCAFALNGFPQWVNG
jgi:hypothetical protein